MSKKRERKKIQTYFKQRIVLKVVVILCHQHHAATCNLFLYARIFLNVDGVISMNPFNLHNFLIRNFTLKKKEKKKTILVKTK